MSRKDARIAELQAEVARLAVRVETLAEQAALIGTCGEATSLMIVQVMKLLSNHDAHFRACHGILGFGFKGAEAVQHFNAVRDLHKATYPDQHDPAHWELPQWIDVDAPAVDG